MNFIIENFKKPKTILMVLGLTAVIVFSVMLIGYESYLRGLIIGPGASVCTDNDGGKNYYQKGTITLSDGTKLTDYCMTGGYKDNVMEYYCAANGHGMTNFKCPNGCANGACVRGTTPPTPACTDSDGGINVMRKGTAKDNSHSYTDYCVGNSIVEYFCQSGVAKRASDSSSGYSCSRYGQNMICKNGACVQGEPEPKCEADGKCKYPGCPNGDPDCACSQQGGDICQTNETCSGTSLIHSGGGTCCSVACTPAAVYSISGKVLKDNSGLSGITINLAGDSSASTATDSSGNYSFSTLNDGSYTITPSNNNYIFSPISHTITIPKGCATTNMNNINFTAISKECNLGETKKHSCPDGTEVDWCTCDNYKWACIDSPENNCPATCEADGKCKTFGCPTGDPDCSCSEYEPSGFICQANETCPGISLTHSGSGICCSVACEGSAVYQTADLNCNGSVNLTDDAILMSFWHKDPFGFDSCQSPDIDQDGDVDLADLAIMMSQWTEIAFY